MEWSEKPEQAYYDKKFAALNAKHAVIMLAGRCLVLNKKKDPDTGRPDIDFSSPADFHNFYANQLVPHPKKDEMVSISKLWWLSKMRENLQGIVFKPGQQLAGYYNLYQGLAIKPKKGDWSLYRDHVYTIIANGNERRAQWILAWLARILQDPGGERPGTSIVLRGKKGTGKGVFINQFHKILGPHFMSIANANAITGRFNGHLRSCLLLFIDEGFWAGDKQAEAVLKNMITEPKISIEYKHKDIIQLDNHLNIIMASNNNWVVPAGLDERRFLVLDVSEEHMQDKAYFAAIRHQMANGGREAMLYDLLRMDISPYDLRTAERTQGLFEQILHSMPTVEKYWFERLRQGTLSAYDDEWNEYILLADQYEEYVEFAKPLGERYLFSSEMFGRELNKLCKGITKKRLRLNGKRPYARYFPSLAECRRQFEALIRMPVDWDDYEDEGDGVDYVLKEGEWPGQTVLAN